MLFTDFAGQLFRAVMHQLRQRETPANIYRIDPQDRAGGVCEGADQMDSDQLLQQQDCLRPH